MDIDFYTGEVTVTDTEGNAFLLDEPYINDLTYLSYDVRYPVTVPEGCVFVMGDNRNHSIDSRHSSIGMIDERKVMGKVLFIVFPGGGDTEQGFGQFEFGRIFGTA